MQDLAKLSQQKPEKLKAMVSGLQELRAKDQRISEEHQKNMYLQRELDKLKLERMWETWLLKNDLRNLEKSNAELQEQLKEQKKRTNASPLLARVLSLSNLTWVLKTVFTAELR
jgi:hypothetical protein